MIIRFSLTQRMIKRKILVAFLLQFTPLACFADIAIATNPISNPIRIAVVVAIKNNLYLNEISLFGDSKVLDTPKWGNTEYLAKITVDLLNKIGKLSKKFDITAVEIKLSQNDIEKIQKTYHNEDADYNEEAQLIANFVEKKYNRILLLTNAYEASPAFGLFYSGNDYKMQYQVKAELEIAYYDRNKLERLAKDECCRLGQRISLRPRKIFKDDLPTDGDTQRFLVAHHTIDTFKDNSGDDLAYISNSIKNLILSHIRGKIFRVLYTSDIDPEDIKID